MKNMLLKTTVSAVAAVMLSGCLGSTQPSKDFSKCYKSANGVQEEVPGWVCKPKMAAALVAVGKGEAGAMANDEAMADGRDKLAAELSIKVSNLMKKFVATTGTGTSQTVDKAMSKVSKQLATAQLIGSKQQDIYEMSNGTVYILVGMPANQKELTETVDKAVKTSFKNDKAMYQKFLASKADGELEAALAK